MREFFRGWKRKAGCVTLMMACAATSASLWTPVWPDVIPRGVRFAFQFDGIKVTAEYLRFIPVVKTYTAINDDGSESQMIKTENQAVSTGMREITIPYWPLALALTLISAWLMLSKPRLAKQPPEPS